MAHSSQTPAAQLSGGNTVHRLALSLKEGQRSECFDLLVLHLSPATPLLSAHWFSKAWNKLTKLPFNCCFDLYNNVLITTLGSSSVLLITWLPLPVGASQNVKRHQTKLNTELNILAHPPSSNYSPKVSVLSAYLQNSFKNDFVLKASLKTKP